MSDVLMIALSAAVPLRMAELKAMRGHARCNERVHWVTAAVDEVACKGDVLQYGGRRGEAANVFNHLARGLAALAYQPGGVAFAGIHWCTAHPGGRACTPYGQVLASIQKKGTPCRVTIR
jgi:hypothetical protein